MSVARLIHYRTEGKQHRSLCGLRCFDQRPRLWRRHWTWASEPLAQMVAVQLVTMEGRNVDCPKCLQAVHALLRQHASRPGPVSNTFDWRAARDADRREDAFDDGGDVTA